MQEGDVLLFQTPDDGDINVTGGLIEMSGGLETAAYLSLFGGNEDDDGSSNNAKTWWANLNEINPVRQYRSETQNLIESLPATTGNLHRVEDAAIRDLKWFIEETIASSVVVVARIPALNKIQITVDIEALGEESRFNFVENWKISA